jgi:phage terminase large subunit-like protein
VIFDEAFEMSPQMIEALLPTLSARRNPQVWYTSSAPLADTRSDVLRALCRRGRAGTSPRLAYFEWCGEDGAGLDDPEVWAQANPGLGLRVSEGFIRDVERVSMSDEGFARERLGIWQETERPSVIPVEKWAAAADARSQIAGPVSVAVDVTPERSGAAIAVAGRRKDGRLHGEVVDAGGGTGWVVPRLQRFVLKPAAVVVDERAAAGGLVRDLEAAGFKVVAVSSSEMVKACGEFYDDVVNDRFRHLDQPELNTALFGARKRDVGDAWAWHRKSSSVDISPLVAVTLARWRAATAPAPKPMVVVSNYGRK